MSILLPFPLCLHDDIGIKPRVSQVSDEHSTTELIREYAIICTMVKRQRLVNTMNIVHSMEIQYGSSQG